MTLTYLSFKKKKHFISCRFRVEIYRPCQESSLVNIVNKYRILFLLVLLYKSIYKRPVNGSIAHEILIFAAHYRIKHVNSEFETDSMIFKSESDLKNLLFKFDGYSQILSKLYPTDNCQIWIYSYLSIHTVVSLYLPTIKIFVRINIVNIP